MDITGTHINYYFVCKRKLWLFANSMQMEHSSDLVYEGKMIHEVSYPQRSAKYEEVAIGGIKIDFYDKKNKVIHEIKKSPKLKNAHIWQLKYYIYVFQKAGITGVSGILEYPKQRKLEEVHLSKDDIERLNEIEQEIISIIHSDEAPEMVKMTRCEQCSYYDFCMSDES